MSSAVVMILVDAEKALCTTIIFVNSSPMSTVDASNADCTVWPAGPLSATRSVGSPERSVEFHTLPDFDSYWLTLTKVASGNRKMVRVSPLSNSAVISPSLPTVTPAKVPKREPS